MDNIEKAVAEDVDLGLNDLTQEDKFFLIQQIEDLNKNIRYCQNSQQNIYQEDENGDEIDYEINSAKKRKSGSKLKYTRNMRNRNQVRGTSRGLDIILDEEEYADQEADGEI